MNYSTNITQSQCRICYGTNTDFEKSPKEYYHLACLLYNSASSAEPFNLSNYLPNEFLISQPCSICKSTQNVYPCSNCHIVFCLSCIGKEQNLTNCFNCNLNFCFTCSLKPEVRVCCENFRTQFKNSTKKCIGCYDVKYNSEFCYRFKCENHDYLCLKCWNFGKTKGICIFGCKINTQWALFTKCLLCREWGPKYLGKGGCILNHDLCDLCGHMSIMEYQKPCSVCSSGLNIS